MSTKSHLKLFRELALLREDPIFQTRDLDYAVITDNIFSFVRKHGEQQTVLVAMNIGQVDSVNNYSERPVHGTFGNIIITTNNLVIGNNRIDLRNIKLTPGQGIVVDVIVGS